MAEFLWFDGWMRFDPLYGGRCLGNLIMCEVGHSIEAHNSEEWGADRC